eukprot:72234-Rhodomonas_salina.1
MGIVAKGKANLKNQPSWTLCHAFGSVLSTIPATGTLSESALARDEYKSKCAETTNADLSRSK